MGRRVESLHDLKLGASLGYVTRLVKHVHVSAAAAAGPDTMVCSTCAREAGPG